MYPGSCHLGWLYAQRAAAGRVRQKLRRHIIELVGEEVSMIIYVDVMKDVNDVHVFYYVLLVIMHILLRTE